MVRGADRLGGVENHHGAAPAADHTSEFALDDAPSNVPTALALERDAREDDAQRLKQRQKQIDFGKNTRGYERYVALVPRDQRKFDDPWTPDKTAPCSKRAFDGRIRKWRRELHKYDEEADGAAAPVDIGHMPLWGQGPALAAAPPTAPRPPPQPRASHGGVADMLSPNTGLPQDPFGVAAVGAAVASDLFGDDADVL